MTSTADTQAPACHRCGADLGPGKERCFAIDTQAIEAALAEYDMPLDVDGFCPHGLIGGSGCSRCERLDHQVATWLCQLLADNARLTAENEQRREPQPTPDLVRLLTHDTSWHGPNDEADWSKGYWTSAGRVAEIVGADNARLTAALAESDRTSLAFTRLSTETVNRLTAALAEATQRAEMAEEDWAQEIARVGEAERLRDTANRAVKRLRAKLTAAEAGAATGRAVARKLLALLNEARECEGLQESNWDLCERIDCGLVAGINIPMDDEAAYLASLSDEPT